MWGRLTFFVALVALAAARAPAPPKEFQTPYPRDEYLDREPSCPVSEHELECVLHFRHQRNLCHCPFSFEVSRLLDPHLPSGQRDVECSHCWKYTTESFCTYLLAEMGAMQCFPKCVKQIGSTRPFHQEKKLGRDFYTYIGAASDNCDLKKAEMYQYRILNHLDEQFPTTWNSPGETYTDWSTKYNQKVHVPGRRDSLFHNIPQVESSAINPPTAATEELAHNLWEAKVAEAKKSSSKSKAPEPLEAAGEGAAVPAKLGVVAAADQRPVFKKFIDTYAAGGGYEHVGGYTDAELQAMSH